MKKVTIGISFYNAELYLKQAIQSVLNQSYRNFELILIDDGSNDTSLAIAKRFKDSRIKLIVDGENKGLIYRLNQIIDLANGYYFARMDADDIMFKNRIQLQIDFLEKNKKYDLVHGNAISINEKNEILGYRDCGDCKNKKDVLEGRRPIHPTVFAKTEWFRNNKYAYGYNLLEDIELWYRTVDNSFFCKISEPILFYRDISTLNSIKYLKSIDAKVQFVKNYKLSFMFSFKWIMKNYLLYLIHKVAEFFKMEEFVLRKRSNTLGNKIIKGYNIQLNNSIL